MQGSSITAHPQQLIEGTLGFLFMLHLSVSDALHEKEIQIVLLTAGQGLERFNGMLVISFQEVAHPQEVLSLVMVRLGLKHLYKFWNSLGE